LSIDFKPKTANLVKKSKTFLVLSFKKAKEQILSKNPLFYFSPQGEII